MGLLVLLLSILLIFSSLNYVLRNILNRKYERKENKKKIGGGVHFSGPLFYISIVALLSVCKVGVVVIKQDEIERLVAGFTSLEISFEGYLINEPEKKHITQQMEAVLLSDVSVDDTVLPKDHGYILIKTENYEKFVIGQVCQFTGYLVEPESFSDFDYKTYLRNKNIFLIMENPKYSCYDIEERRGGSVIKNVLIDLKENIIDVIDSIIQEPQSSLLAGILFGKKRLFSNTFGENIRMAGVSHIVAASGYNITILVMTINKLFFFLNKKGKIILGLIVIWMFAIFSGLSSSIVRACIMSTFSLFAILLGRSNTVHISLPLASAVFVFFDPLIIYDVGFLLSVSATLGLVYILPILIAVKEKITKKFQILNDYLLPTMSCTLSTLPISIMTFKTFSLWSIPVNTLILPVIEGTMLWGVLSILLVNIHRSLSYLFFTAVNLQLKYFEYIVNVVGNLNIGSWEILNSKEGYISITLLIILLLLTIYFYPIDNEKYNYYLKDR